MMSSVMTIMIILLKGRQTKLWLVLKKMMMKVMKVMMIIMIMTTMATIIRLAAPGSGFHRVVSQQK